MLNAWINVSGNYGLHDRQHCEVLIPSLVRQSPIKTLRRFGGVGLMGAIVSLKIVIRKRGCETVILAGSGGHPRGKISPSYTGYDQRNGSTFPFSNFTNAHPVPSHIPLLQQAFLCCPLCRSSPFCEKKKNICGEGIQQSVMRVVQLNGSSLTRVHPDLAECTLASLQFNSAHA